MSPPPKLSRRTLTLGAMAAAVAAFAGGLYELPKLLRRHAHGEHAALINLLADPDAAAMVGRAAKSDIAEESAAADLKTRLKGRALADLAREDNADLDGLVEVEGWMVPLAIAELCVLAAQAM